VHDFNPGISQHGLFWTSIVPNDRVRVDASTGRATVDVRDLHVQDYTDIVNAVSGVGPSPVPSVVSYRVEWEAAGAVNAFDNPGQQFRGAFRVASARMTWTARTPDFNFVSAPMEASNADFAQLGTERNGALY